jgi:hypothetical protein
VERRSGDPVAALSSEVKRSVTFAIVLAALASCTAGDARLTASPARVGPAVAQPATQTSAAPVVIVPAEPDATVRAEPVAPSGPSRVVWRFTQTLLLPPDPNRYSNVLLDVEPLAGGGWVVVQNQAPARRLPRAGGGSGGVFIPTRGMVMRLDASGAVVALQQDAQAFAPTHLVLFERSGTVVAQGAGTRGLDLKTLDALWGSDAECVAVGERCFAYRPMVLPPPGAVEERDPRTFGVVRSLPHVEVGQLTTPMVLPDWNLAIVQSTSSGRSFDFFPLDPAAAITLPWIDRLRQAKSIGPLFHDRLVVSYEGWGSGRLPKSELIDLATGRLVADFDWIPAFANRSVTYLQGPTPLQVLDPRDVSVGLQLPSYALYVNMASGIIVVALGNGGAAVLRRAEASGLEYDIPVARIAQGICDAIDFTRVQLADGTADCVDLATAAGPRRMLVSLGLGSADAFDLTRISVDEASRRLTIGVRVGDSSGAAQRAPSQVIELPEGLTGRWLVGLEPEPATPRPFGFDTAFAIDLP